jgi:hypothetical protein
MLAHERIARASFPPLAGFLQLAGCHQRQDLVDGEQVAEHFLAQCFLRGGRQGGQLTVIFGQCLAGQK